MKECVFHDRLTVGVALGLSLMTCGLFADELTWVPTVGGVLDDAVNWEVKSSSKDIHQINKVQTGPLTLGNDWAIGEFYFRGTTNELSLGTGNTLTCSVFNLYSSSEVRLTSGLLAPSGEQRVGNGSSNNRLVIDGPNTEYVSGNSAKQLTLGHTSSNNRVEVLNGAKFTASVRLGYNSGSRNSLLVAGANTVWSNQSSMNTLIGASSASWGSSVTVADGARFVGGIDLPAAESSVSNEFVLCGVGTTWDRGGSTADIFLGYKRGGDYTQFVVSNGVEFAVGCKFRVASDSDGNKSLSEHNRILVASGAKLAAQTIYVEGNNNSVEVTGPDSVLSMTSGHYYFPRENGNGAAAGTNNVLRIADGGTLKIMEPADAKNLYVYGSNVLDIDGGAMDVYGEVDFGYYGRGMSYSRVTNGGTFTKHGSGTQLFLGVGGESISNVLEVSNGGVVRMADGGTFRINNNGGYANALIVDNGTFDLGSGQGYIGNVQYDKAFPADAGDRIVVRNNGVFTGGKLTVGRANPYERLEVVNGRVNLSGDLLVSYESNYASSSNAVLHIAGTNTSVTVGGTMTLSKTATLIIDVTGPQVMEAMLAAAKFAFKTGSKIRITSSADLKRINSFRATVLKSTNSNIDFSPATIEVDPACGLKVVTMDSKSLVVRHQKPGRLKLIVR